MFKRSITVGIVGGVLISLAGVYPVLSLLTPLWLAGWQRPLSDDLSHGIALMVSAVLFVPLLLFLGVIAARRAQVRGMREGAKAGGLAGLFAAFIIYFTLIAPINAMIAFGTVGAELDVLADSYLPSAVVLDSYVTSFQNVSLQVEVVLLLGTLFWGMQGLLVGWLRRHHKAPSRPSLFQIVKEGDNPKQFFVGNESALQVGLLVGILVGILTILAGSGLS
jgi:hypothetical protein